MDRQPLLSMASPSFNCQLVQLGCLSVLLASLLTCRSPVDDLLKRTSLQIVLAQNRPPKPVYFWEDSLQRQVSFELYYFDQNQRFTPLTEKPVFFVNDQPMKGNTFTFSGPGQYAFSARINTRASDNQLVLTVSKATDYLNSVVLKAAVPLLNADSLSQLPLTYELIDKQGKVMSTADYPVPQLWVDDQLHPQAAFFSTPKAGTHRLEAMFFGVRSNVLTVTARPSSHFPLIRLPVVFHLPKGVAPDFDPVGLLASVNQFYRMVLPGTDPNRVDTAIEFYPAPVDPQGQPMAIAGLHSLSSGDLASTAEAWAIVTDLLHTWCPRQYINVIVGLNWIDAYTPNTNYAFMPALMPVGVIAPTCQELAATNWSAAQLPAVHLAPVPWSGDNGTFAHELGHFLGLTHSFRSTCAGNNVWEDVPVYLESERNQYGVKYSCQKAAFVADNLMDYNSNWRSFTQDQVRYMRLILERGFYTPSPSVAPNPKTERKPFPLLNQGSVIP